MPQYKLGHHEIVSECRRLISERHLPLSLLGNSYEGASVNDCIYNARKEVESVAVLMQKNEL